MEPWVAKLQEAAARLRFEWCVLVQQEMHSTAMHLDGGEVEVADE
jgi:hypothetical protein